MAKQMRLTVRAARNDLSGPLETWPAICAIKVPQMAYSMKRTTMSHGSPVQPRMGRTAMVLTTDITTIQKRSKSMYATICGVLRTPLAYCSERVLLRRSMAGYTTKKAGYAAWTRAMKRAKTHAPALVLCLSS